MLSQCRCGGIAAPSRTRRRGSTNTLGLVLTSALLFRRWRSGVHTKSGEEKRENFALVTWITWLWLLSWLPFRRPPLARSAPTSQAQPLCCAYFAINIVAPKIHRKMSGPRPKARNRSARLSRLMSERERERERRESGRRSPRVCRAPARCDPSSRRFSRREGWHSEIFASPSGTQ